MTQVYYRIIIIFGLLILLTAAAPSSADENIMLGKRMFNSYCSLCHGEDGKGTGVLAGKISSENPIPDLTDKKFQSRSVDEIQTLIQMYNRYGSIMPNWEKVIAESNLRHIAAYILAITQPDVRLRGDARRGREVYRRSCVACHGQRGEGNGVLAKMLDTEMINYRTEALSEVTDKHLIETITDGKGKHMPAWGGILSAGEIKDVAVFIRAMYKH